MRKECVGIAVAVLMLTVACASGPQLRSTAATSNPLEHGLFDFRIGFWVNLHQRLYAESGPQPPAEVLRAPSLDQADWDRAVDFYRRRFPDRGFLALLENEELVGLNRRLAELGDASDVSSARLPAELALALESAARVYRRTRWPSDEAAARQFLHRLAPLLERHGQAIAAAHARAYMTPWPEQPIRVDLAAFAGPVGAYTVLEPTHITLASSDRRHVGNAALEILFHEASHSLIRAIQESITRVSASQNKPTPSSLWHAVLFWLTGELVRRELGSDYTPYAFQNGLFRRNPQWKAVEPVLTRSLTEYLDGRRSLEDAIRQIASEPESGPAPASPGSTPERAAVGQYWWQVLHS